LIIKNHGAQGHTVAEPFDQGVISMAAESRYIISFIVDNQPQSRVVTHESETLDKQQAETLLKHDFPEFNGAKLTDIQVQKRTKPEEGDNIPGHYQQP
jgi:hypothetical protein